MVRHCRVYMRKRLYAILIGALLLLVVAACRPTRDSLPDVLYLGWDDSGRIQLYRQTPSVETAVPLTGHAQTIAGEVTTFSPSPNGDYIAYSLLSDEGGSEIRLISAATGEDESLLLCPLAECSEMAWAPDNTRLVYERRELSGSTAGQPRLWWLDTISGETIPLIDEEKGPAYGATFSPDGQWLAYVSPVDEGVIVVNLNDGGQRLLPSATGVSPRWSPDSRSVVFSRHDLIVRHGAEGDEPGSHDHDYATAVHLYRQELTQPTAPRRLSPDLAVDDSAAAWSPDSQWLVIGRRAPETAGGRQLWMMRADGSEARQLTDDPTQHYGSVSWSPDGRYLLYQRYPVFVPDAQASVWMMELETGEERQLAVAGYVPRWSTGSG